MLAVDLTSAVVIPQLVTVVGALVAGVGAVLRSWIENRDARARGDRRLELAGKRTASAKEWLEISDLDESLRKRAHKNLAEAVDETERALYEASADSSTALRQLWRLLLLVRRRNPASYVLAVLFLFLSVFVWLLVCIPAPGDDDFSVPGAIALSIAITLLLRVAVGLLISLLENRSTSGGETLTELTVSNGAATMTTKGPHRLKKGDEIVVDASDDRFDGTFIITNKTEWTFSFKPSRWVADVESHEMHGWVCGESVKNQILGLFMIRGGRPRRPVAVSVLFLASVLGVSIWSVGNAVDDFDGEQYPLCYGEPYDGGYFGYFDLFQEVQEATEFLNSEAPVWGEPRSLPIGNVAPSGSGNTLVADDGTEFALDEFQLRYADEGVVLYRRDGDRRLTKIGEPCRPQQLNVRVTSEEDEAVRELFNFYDDTAGFETGEELFLIYPGTGDDADQQINAYFGPDGRLIAVCDELNYPEIQPCLEPDNVYVDAGLEALINRAFLTGLWILGFAIVARLLGGWLANKLEPPEPRSPDTSAVES